MITAEQARKATKESRLAAIENAIRGKCNIGKNSVFISDIKEEEIARLQEAGFIVKPNDVYKGCVDVSW